MTHRRKFSRRLRSELLEARLVLSAEAVVECPDAVESFGSLYPEAVDVANPHVRAAIQSITTTASDEVVFRIDPGPAVTGADEQYSASLAESTTLIGLSHFRDDARFAGIDGSGFSIVIIDTGADLDHPFFGPDADNNGVADRIVYNADFFGDRANGADGNGHGTHVASIAGSQDATHTGIAPGVNLIVLRVLNDAGVGTAASIESALQWVVANVDNYNIASVNMSLSTFENFTDPDTRPDLGFADELSALASQDVIVAAAAGNAYFEFLGAPGIAYPSSDPNVLAVSATWDADVGGPIVWESGATDFTTGIDRVVSFSQRHPVMTTIFAPGALIAGAAIGGGLQVMGGTSMASPMVAGAAALAQQLAVQLTGERLSVSQFKDLLQSSAVQIFDGDDEHDNVRNTNASYGRLNVLALGEAILAAVQSDLYFTEELTIESVDVPAGGTARLAYAFGNGGLPETGDFVGSFYLSGDPTIDATDTLLSSFTMQLGGLQSWAGSGIAVPLPVGVALGQYYVGLVLDSGHSVVESDEANNVSVVAVTLSESRPEVRLVDETSGAVLPSGLGTIDFGVVDQGAGDVERTVRIYNDGSERLTLGPLVLPEGYRADDFPTEVPAGESVQFTVRLVSTNDVAEYTGVASFASNDADENPFTLQLQGAIAEPDDHGGDAATATIVTMPAIVDGTIFASDEVDWFRIRAVAGVEHTFRTILGTLSDSVLRLYDSDGVTQLTSDDDSGPGAASLIQWTAPHDGYFYLEVSRKQNAFGTYQLSATAADDHGGDLNGATPISDPSLTPGVIETSGDVDWYSFPAIAGIKYEIETGLFTLGGSTIRVFDSDGVSQLAISSPTAPSLGSLIHWTAPASGNFFIAIEGSSGSQLGAYDLKLIADDDYGDYAASAAALSVPGAIDGVIEHPLDGDWFRFATIAGARYQFLAPATSTEYVIRVFDVDGTTELATAEGGVGVTELQWVAPTGGSYYVEVSAAGSGVGPYELTASIVDDYGDNAATATNVSDPSVIAGAIVPTGDVDVLQLNVATGVEYRFEATVGELSNLNLRLLAADGVTVIHAEAASAGRSADIDWVATAAGPVYLEITAGSPGAVGSYQVSINGNDDHGDSAIQATALSIPHPVDGNVETPNDADWFSLTTIFGLVYRVEVGLGTLREAHVRLFASDGTTLVAEAVSDGDPLVAIQWTAADSTYFVEIVPLAPAVTASTSATPIGDYRVTPLLLSPLPGDFDGNDRVDGYDLLVWQRLVGRTSNTALSPPLDTGGFEDYQFDEGEEPLLVNADEGWVQLGPPGGLAWVVEIDSNTVVRVDRGADADNRWGVPLGPISPVNNAMIIMWDMMVEQNNERAGALGPFFGVEAYDDVGVFGLLGSFGVDATSLDLVYQAQDTGYFTETGVKAAAGVWHTFAISLDYARHEYTVYFDGQPLATTGFVDRGPLHTALDQLTDADISALASQGNGASRNATGTAYYDNFKIVNGVSGDFLRADGNRDGVVDRLDLQLWKDHYGLDFSGSGSPAVAASATPMAPASSLAMPAVKYEATWLNASVKQSPSVATVAAQGAPGAGVAWLAYDDGGAGGHASQASTLRRGEYQDLDVLRNSAPRDVALAQLAGGKVSGMRAGQSWDEAAETEDGADDAGWEPGSGAELDAMWAAF